jgi:hypothetical protein
MDLVRILKQFGKLNTYNQQVMCEVRLSISATKRFSLLRSEYLSSKSGLMWLWQLQQRVEGRRNATVIDMSKYWQEINEETEEAERQENKER